MGALPRSARGVTAAFAAARFRAAIGCGAAFSVLSLGVAAFGDGASPPSAPAPLATPSAKSGPPRAFLEICGQGNAKFAKHDVQGAIERYRTATMRFPDEPLGYALLGESLLVAGNAADARAALTRGASAGDKDSEARLRSRVVLAVLEEHEQNWDAARTAWQAVLDARQGAPDGGAAGIADARIHVIDTVRRQAVVTDEVRKRIAATADGGVFSDPSKPAPGNAR
jgi:hypothetical protein